VAYGPQPATKLVMHTLKARLGFLSNWRLVISCASRISAIEVQLATKSVTHNFKSCLKFLSNWRRATPGAPRISVIGAPASNQIDDVHH
jgi:uncharacterized membrane protein YhfC